MDNQVENFSRYVCVYAHPDDEVYACAFLKSLVAEGKKVVVVYVTSGDYQGPEMGPLREKEALASMQAVGVGPSDVHFLRIPERQLMSRLSDVIVGLQEVVAKENSELVLSHDFEGGHNGHDAVSFCASRIAAEKALPFFVFPAYYDWPERRVWNEFAPGREASYIHKLSSDEQALKAAVIAAHASQKSFFDIVAESKNGHVLRERELLRMGPNPHEYVLMPTNPVGYEYPGSKLQFQDFKNAIEAVHSNITL
jgi:LmbE family N-acetylglucosaminyl deacetylase